MIFSSAKEYLDTDELIASEIRSNDSIKRHSLAERFKILNNGNIIIQEPHHRTGITKVR